MARPRLKQRDIRDAILLISGVGMAVWMMLNEKVDGSLVLLVSGWTMTSLTLRIDEAIGRAKAKASGRDEQ